MKEIRKDLITGDIAIYSSYRNKRPHDKTIVTNRFDGNDSEYDEKCPFCRGNEASEEDLKEEVLCDDKWIAKSVGNKFPIIDMSTDEIYGLHEVIIETYRHNGSFYNMSEYEYRNFLKLLVSRYASLKNMDNIKYINIFKNFQRNSGASLMHPHSQITSFNLIPPEVEKELKVAKEYFDTNGESVYEYIIRTEIKSGERVVFNGKYFLVIIPYATRYNGEIRIIQKDEVSIDDYSNEHIVELASLFRKLFIKWDEYQGEIPFNMVIHSYPVESECKDIFRTHYHIIPRKYNFGGFELSTNLFVCGTDPNELASLLRFD